jgi:hypothetical protein
MDLTQDVDITPVASPEPEPESQIPGFPIIQLRSEANTSQPSQALQQPPASQVQPPASQLDQS